MPGTVTVGFVLTGELSQSGAIEVLHLASDDADHSTWRMVGRRVVAMENGRLELAGHSGDWTLIVFRAPGAMGYALHGPFTWPSAAALIPVTLFRLRTVRAPASVLSDATSLQWLSANEHHQPRPMCRKISLSSAECIGIPWNDSGVLLVHDSKGNMRFGVSMQSRVPTTIEEVRLRGVPWGGLFQIVTPMPPSDVVGLHASIWRSSRPSPAGRSSRLVLRPAPGYQVFWLTPAAFWLAGPIPPDDAVLQVEGNAIATVRLALGPLRGNSSDQFVAIHVHPALEVAGQVLSPDGRPVPGALVVVSEFLDDSGSVQQTHENALFRRRCEEVVADDGGAFVVPGLDRREYEWLVVHPEFGRAAVVQRPASPVVIAFGRNRTIVGRAVRRGAPVAGVPVSILPTLADLTKSPDPLEQMGVETRSDARGRFRAAVPSGAGGEVRVGSNDTGIARHSFRPGIGASLIDLGDVELPGVPRVRVLLDGRDGCEVSALGPLGRVGMQIISSTPQPPGSWTLALPEAGRWSLVLTCAGAELATDPAFVVLAAAETQVTVSLQVIAQP